MSENFPSHETSTDQKVQEQVKQRLRESCSHAIQFQEISFEYSEGTLVLSGTLPTYYAKQLLQTALRDIEGVHRVENRVQVVKLPPSNDENG